MNKLETGTVIKSQYDVNITIEKHLGEGGQGDVYQVKYGNDTKALKWYKKNALGDDPEVLRNLITQNIEAGSPNDDFLWPTDITEYKDGTFGYIMGLRPQGYYEISEYLLRKARFTSYKTVVDASLNIVNAFRILHNSGYSYQDMNDGNFFIDPKTGKVLICDNDNVAPSGTPTRILGKPGYMAPEIVKGDNKPDEKSDRFSLSVILFLLLCLNHPLAGKRITNVAVVTPALEKDLYGVNPLFIMDKDDNSNAPNPLIHKNVLNTWKYLPSYIQDIYYKAFSKDGLHEPNKRPQEFEWLEALTRFRSDIIKCQCGCENFADNAKVGNCDGCAKPVAPLVTIELPKYNIPAFPGSRVYRCQLSTCNATEALDIIAKIVPSKSDPTKYGLKNVWNLSLTATTTKGEKREVKPSNVVPVKSGIIFNTGKGEFEFV